MVDADGFDRFVEDNYASVARTVALSIGDATPAHDHVQEAFARAYERWNRVSRMERPVAWVYVVALNHARRDLRRRTTDLAEHEERRVDDPSGTIVTSMSIRTALECLTARQRAVVVLRYLTDLSTDEVARALHCAPGTVKATLSQALARLRVEMSERDIDDWR